MGKVLHWMNDNWFLTMFLGGRVAEWCERKLSRQAKAY